MFIYRTKRTHITVTQQAITLIYTKDMTRIIYRITPHADTTMSYVFLHFHNNILRESRMKYATKQRLPKPFYITRKKWNRLFIDYKKLLP